MATPDFDVRYVGLPDPVVPVSARASSLASRCPPQPWCRGCRLPDQERDLPASALSEAVRLAWKNATTFNARIAVFSVKGDKPRAAGPILPELRATRGCPMKPTPLITHPSVLLSTLKLSTKCEFRASIDAKHANFLNRKILIPDQRNPNMASSH